MRFVAPPGMTIDGPDARETIGRYEIIETLGKGAMGVVYKARDPLLDRTVAVKTIVSPKHGGRRVRRAYLERFEREAKAAAKMQHPAIVTIFDVGLEEGLPFMVLEYLPGESLADRLDRVRLPLIRAVDISLDLASALGFAHKTRIVHRDVKPANVLHAGENRWKLADFGIARMPDSDLTQVGIFMGTPGYAPPEAISNGHYTPQADVFAWGAVLYELLSGRIAYEGPDTQTTNSYVLKAAAPPPTKYDPSIPAPLADVTMRALHPSTEERYKNGAEAEHALRKAWELCLNSNLVAPSSLTGTEVPHSKAPAAFHKPQNLDSPERPTSHSIGEPKNSSQSAPTVLDEHDEHVEIGGRGDSEEPMTVRQDLEDFEALAKQTKGKSHGRPVQPLGTTEADIIATAKATAQRQDTGKVGSSDVLAAEKPQIGVWIAVILLALIAGGAGAYLLLGL
jgi:serine/threonine-protein kinase